MTRRDRILRRHCLGDYAMKPKWQRARIIVGDDDIRGNYLWIKSTPPRLIRAQNVPVDFAAGSRTETTLSLETNVIDPLLRSSMVVAASDVELLPDFADDVPFVEWQDFLAECRNSRAH